jgi:hypothetical protein
MSSGNPRRIDVYHRHWSPERMKKLRQLQKPDPEHVRKLRAGIADFRMMLELREKH